MVAQVGGATLAIRAQGFADRTVEIASITSADDGRINCKRDAVVFFRNPDVARQLNANTDQFGRYFIHNQSSLFETLQFPLFFPTGQGGWYCAPPHRHDGEEEHVPPPAAPPEFDPPDDDDEQGPQQPQGDYFWSWFLQKSC